MPEIGERRGDYAIKEKNLLAMDEYVKRVRLEETERLAERRRLDAKKKQKLRRLALKKQQAEINANYRELRKNEKAKKE
jgi:transcription elongation GreA/GreB family factor